MINISNFWAGYREEKGDARIEMAWNWAAGL